MGGDLPYIQQLASVLDFNPRLPDGRRPRRTRKAHYPTHFNPRLPDGRRPFRDRLAVWGIAISIHASRMGGDVVGVESAAPFRFQSTPPGWEATTAQRRHMQRHPISIHASRMGGDACEPGEVATEIISIHASRMGGDSLSFAGSSPQSKFQSTPPGWEATHQHGQPDDRGDISIHASRMGGDRNSFGIFTHAVDFNPRLPDGRRPEPMACGSADTTFQSTPPGWEATYLRSIMSQKILISIHASRMGGDSLDRTTVPVFHVFQSTPPGWEATLSNY